MKKGIIFDLDGTLWDSSLAVATSWNIALAKLKDIDCRVDVETMHKLMGKTLDEIAKLVFNNVSESRALEIMNSCLMEEQRYIIAHGGILYPKLEETLNQLSKDYYISIVSNCQSGYIEAFLEFHKLGTYFCDFECWGNTRCPKSDNIRLVAERNSFEKAVYVGDTLGDFNSAKAACIPFIHAKYGFGIVNEAEYSVNSLVEIPYLAKKLLN